MTQGYAKGIFQEYDKGICQEYGKGGKTIHTPPIAKLTPMPKINENTKKNSLLQRLHKNALKYKTKILYY